MTRTSGRRGGLVLCCAAASLVPIDARAASQTGTAEAVALRPLSLVKLDDLDFGTLVAGTTAGTVVISPTTTARSTTGGTIASGGAPGPARFRTYTGQNVRVRVFRGALPVLTRAGGGATMNVTALTLDGPVDRRTNAAGVLDFAVGATLAVAANQRAGTYTGTFELIVNFN